MENCNYTCLLTSAFHVVRKAFSGCLFRDNDLAGRYRRKDNHRWTSADVVKMTPCPHLFQYDYLTTAELGFTYIKSLSEKKCASDQSTEMVQRKWLSSPWLA